VRGDIHRLRAPRDARGREQSGPRYAVVLQSDLLPLSTLLVAPTSTSARPAEFRPKILVRDQVTQVQVEQTVAVAPTRLGALVGRVSWAELQEIDEALKLALDL
jgi:mRNA interferase MazF